MAHHPMSFSQNSLYLHSSGSEGIDCAEGARLFFYCGSRRVLLNHRRPAANDSPSPCRPNDMLRSSSSGALRFHLVAL